jgi:hypothetical protein
MPQHQLMYLTAALEEWLVPAIARYFLQRPKTGPQWNGNDPIHPRNGSLSRRVGTASGGMEFVLTDLDTVRSRSNVRISTTGLLGKASNFLRSSAMIELQYKPLTLSVSQASPSAPVWFYGRYSDAEMQSKSSIDQQIKACRDAAAKENADIPDDCVFADHGIRGAEENRPELNRL